MTTCQATGRGRCLSRAEGAVSKLPFRRGTKMGSCHIKKLWCIYICVLCIYTGRCFSDTPLAVTPWRGPNGPCIDQAASGKGPTYRQAGATLASLGRHDAARQALKYLLHLPGSQVSNFLDAGLLMQPPSDCGTERSRRVNTSIAMY